MDAEKKRLGEACEHVQSKKIKVEEMVPPSDPTKLLFDAIRRGNAQKAIQALDAGANVNARKTSGVPVRSSYEKQIYNETPLHWAAKKGQVAIVHELLKRGAKVNVQTIARDRKTLLNTPLFLAAQEGFPYPRECFIEVARLLLEAGANPNLRGEEGYTVLHFAALHRNEEMAALLLTNGAQPSLMNDQGETALHKIIRRNDRHHNWIRMIRLFLNHGFAIDQPNDQGETLLCMVVKMRSRLPHAVVADPLGDSTLKTIKFLLLHGAAPRGLQEDVLQQVFKEQPLSLACIIGNMLLLNTLLNPDTSLSYLTEAFMYAAAQKQKAIIIRLLQFIIERWYLSNDTTNTLMSVRSHVQELLMNMPSESDRQEYEHITKILTTPLAIASILPQKGEHARFFLEWLPADLFRQLIFFVIVTVGSHQHR